MPMPKNTLSDRHIEDVDSPFSYVMAEQEVDTLSMVKQSLEAKRVVLAFQPVVQANNPSRVAYYEGLTRVLDDTGRIIPAKDFISTIEDTEVGRIIDCLAVEMGMQALAAEPSLRLSINMSARSIGYQRWTQTLERGLKDDPTVGERLILEICEESAMKMPELVTTFMDTLQTSGISFALDDFGAGYTAFRHLKDFLFDIIKIDGQFIRGIAESPDNQVLTKALASIAEHFEMFTVASNVERAEDVAYLQSIGIDCLQGNYIGAPTIRPPWKQDDLKNSA